MSTLLASAPVANISATSPTKAKAPANLSTAPARAALENAAWQALSYVSSKQADRDALAPGAAHSIDLHVSGSVDGQPIDPIDIAGRLTVGHDSTRASSSTPNLPQVVAAILAKLNDATRAAILRDLPTEFAANGGSLPDVSVGAVAEAESLLAALKSSKQVNVRGQVRCEYSLSPASPAFGLVG